MNNGFKMSVKDLKASAEIDQNVAEIIEMFESNHQLAVLVTSTSAKWAEHPETAREDLASPVNENILSLTCFLAQLAIRRIAHERMMAIRERIANGEA